MKKLKRVRGLIRDEINWLAIQFLHDRGRDVLRKHFPGERLCIPATRLALEFCRRIAVPCDIQSVVAFVRNKIATDLGILPTCFKEFDPGRTHPDAAIVVVGMKRTQRTPGPLDIDIHMVPIVCGHIVDMTLDAHTDRPEHGFTKLPTIVIPWPGAGKMGVADLETDPPTSIGYAPKDDLRFLKTPYWKEFWIQGGREAVEELVAEYVR